jgi:hypothetical protein
VIAKYEAMVNFLIRESGRNPKTNIHHIPLKKEHGTEPNTSM